jgi:hypothetical protein
MSHQRDFTKDLPWFSTPGKESLLPPNPSDFDINERNPYPYQSGSTLSDQIKYQASQEAPVPTSVVQVSIHNSNPLTHPSEF